MVLLKSRGTTRRRATPTSHTASSPTHASCHASLNHIHSISRQSASTFSSLTLSPPNSSSLSSPLSPSLSGFTTLCFPSLQAPLLSLHAPSFTFSSITTLPSSLPHCSTSFSTHSMLPLLPSMPPRLPPLVMSVPSSLPPSSRVHIQKATTLSGPRVTRR